MMSSYTGEISTTQTLKGIFPITLLIKNVIELKLKAA